jgi:hypothetical protein
MISTGFNWFVTNGPWPHAYTICPCPTSWQLINRYPFTQQLVCLLILQKWIIFQQKCGSGRLKIVISHYIKISKTNRSIVVNDVLFKGVHQYKEVISAQNPLSLAASGPPGWYNWHQHCAHRVKRVRWVMRKDSWQGMKDAEDAEWHSPISLDSEIML